MTSSSGSSIRAVVVVVRRIVRFAAQAALGFAIALGPASAAQQLTQVQQLQEQRLPPDATGRIDQRFRDAPTPPSSAQPPLLQVEPPPPEVAPESAANIPLQIEALKLTGVTVYQNGVKIQDDVKIPVDNTRAGRGGDVCTPGPIMLQDHGSPVQFRNIWLLLG